MLRKHDRPAADFDRADLIPVIRASICNGERVASFKSVTSGKFTDVMLIRTEADYRKFLRVYQIDPADVKKEW